MTTPEGSICFSEACDLRSEGRIQLEEYLKHIVAHYKGVRHETDAEGKRPFLSIGFEDEVRKIILDEKYEPLGEDGIALLYSIFLGAFRKDFPTVQTLLDASSLPVQTYRSPLVEIAKETGDARLLRCCLDLGYDPSEGSMLSCRTREAPSTEWLDALYDFDFCQWRTDKAQLNQWKTWQYVFNMGPDCVRWWIAHGGKTKSARGLFEGYHPRWWLGAPACRVLLKHFGIEWFTNSGTLQLAAKKHDFETVTMLVEAGANVNEEVDDWNRDVREHRSAPLSALNEAMYAKSERMIRYLIDHGAKLSRKDVDDPYDIMPQEFKPFQQLVVELDGVELDEKALM